MTLSTFPPITQPLLLDVGNTTLHVTSEQSRLTGISLDKFIPIVPDFVVELRSASDNLSPLQVKMREYQRLGARFGMLINPQSQQVEVYRVGQETEVLELPMSIDCGEVMPGFILNLAKIW